MPSWQMMPSTGRSTAKSCAQASFPSSSNITVMAYTIHDLIWPQQSAHCSRDALQVLQDNCIRFIPKKKDARDVTSFCPMEEYWAFLKKITYDGRWEAKYLDQLRERIKGKARKIPIEPLQNCPKPSKIKFNSALNADNGQFIVSTSSSNMLI